MNILNGLLFSQYKLHHRCSTELYIGLWKYWNFQSEAKVEQIIAIVTTRSVSCKFWLHSSKQAITSCKLYIWIFWSNSKTTNKCITFSKRCTVWFQEASFNLYCYFELWIHFSFGARLLPGVVGNLMLSSDNPLDFHAMMFQYYLGIMKALEMGWNTY